MNKKLFMTQKEGERAFFLQKIAPNKSVLDFASDSNFPIASLSNNI